MIPGRAMENNLEGIGSAFVGFTDRIQLFPGNCTELLDCIIDHEHPEEEPRCRIGMKINAATKIIL